MATEAQKKAAAKYDAANTKQIHLKLNLNTDADLISWLDKIPNVQGYIKDLINRDRKNDPYLDKCGEDYTGVKIRRF